MTLHRKRLTSVPGAQALKHAVLRGLGLEHLAARGVSAHSILLTCTYGLMLLWGTNRSIAQDASGPAATPQPGGETSETAPSESESDAAETSEPIVPLEPPKFILRPYNVRLLISFAARPAFTQGAAERIAENAVARLRSQFRQMWNLTADAAHSTQRNSIQQIFALDPGETTARWLETEHDKVLFASIDESTGRYDVAVREWDASSRSLGSVHEFDTFDRRDVSALIAQASGEAFRPITELEVMHEEQGDFLIRAGEYPPRDLSVEQFRVGDYLTPYLRYLDRQRVVQRIQSIPWTYLRVEEITRSRIRVSVVSAFKNPIASSRRRVEVMAMRIRPHLSQTEVRVYPRGKRLNPLVGFRCEVMDRLPTEDDPVEDRFKLETDRRGIVTVPVRPMDPLQYLFVHSGVSVLARVPFIPGDQPFLEVEVPDDSARLHVEGEVSLLQGELIDIVATREVLMARTRGASTKENWKDVDRFLQQLSELPTLQDFENRIETLRVQAVYSAQLARDRIAELRIRRLCRGITDSAEKHLDPFRIAEFRREMNSLKPQ